MTYRIAKDKHGNEIKVPVLDVRNSKQEREQIATMTKLSNGNMSKYIPAKYGYGPHGPIKY